MARLQESRGFMATDNKSPSYLEEREQVRRWFQKTQDGKEARRILMDAVGGDASRILDDDKHVDWEEMVKDYAGCSVLAASCREAREAFEIARQSKSSMGPPGVDKGKWVHWFSTPIGYVLRRQIELADPDYWNDPINVFREAMDHPEWCRVPMDVIRGELEMRLPKNRDKRVVLTDAPAVG